VLGDNVGRRESGAQSKAEPASAAHQTAEEFYAAGEFASARKRLDVAIDASALTNSVCLPNAILCRDSERAFSAGSGSGGVATTFS